GVPVRVDGPQNVLVLEQAEGAAELRRRVARMVRRLIGASLGRPQAADQDGGAEAAPEDVTAEPEQGFIVTDGHQSHAVTVIEVPDTGARLVMFVGELPPEGRDMWVVRVAIDRTHRGAGARHAGGVICFTPDTRIATPEGPKLIQHLRPGDRVLTRDDGPQPILWTGHRRMTGARLYAMPHLRPIRFRAGAFGTDRPDGDLLVSPQHRMLIRGPQARALFNSDEVLVAAEDLLNDRSVVVDHGAREVTYIHLLLERHSILFANGMESESFHPSNTALDTIEDNQRAGLLALLPGIEANPESYGDYARRNLSASEAAILRHDMAA
ncbi:Hint domain-containing protein, partial [Gemmobacter sp.]|uniref:Hint domain-containing protein n=1 Tax=Gemmobacter sp. TaxID=1898957 RepID=UPI003455E6D3